MQNLEKRIAALESAQTPSEGMTIIRRIVAPDNLNAEIFVLRDMDGRTWAREAGESEAAFENRAALEAGKAGGVVLLRGVADGIDTAPEKPTGD